MICKPLFLCYQWPDQRTEAAFSRYHARLTSRLSVGA